MEVSYSRKSKGLTARLGKINILAHKKDSVSCESCQYYGMRKGKTKVRNRQLLIRFDRPLHKLLYSVFQDIRGSVYLDTQGTISIHTFTFP